MLKSLLKFLKLESASGMLLFAATLSALFMDNSRYASFYEWFLRLSIGIHVGAVQFERPMLFWINEGLMTLFFLLIGLALKREYLQGVLAQWSQITLPGIAALGGMVVPALIYGMIHRHDAATLKGWAIPVATDIAFALGVLTLFGKRVPIGLKLFLMVLATFDDIGAIIIIAFFHAQSVYFLSILLIVGLTFILWGLNRFRVQALIIYLLVGGGLWVCLLYSGLHATLAGILLALWIPLTRSASSPLIRLENFLHPGVAYFIMPLFAFANAGLSFAGMSNSVLTGKITQGIIWGLFLGKQIGIFSLAWATIKLGWAKRPAHTSWLALYGVSILCGVGFTMSLFLGTLAFHGDLPEHLVEVRLGVLIGSLLSGVVGAFVLYLALLTEKKQRIKNEAKTFS